MHRSSLICATLLIVACSKPQDSATRADTTAAPALFSLSSAAGQWNVKGYNAAGDSIVGYVLTATNDTTGWTITFPGRPAMPMRVSVVGDAIRTTAGPYESVLRPGVQVRTEATMRMNGDSIYGNTVAHYAGTGPDTMLNIRAVGRRVAH
jgi:hypothetical protein